MKSSHDSQEGAALVTSLLVTVLLFGVAGAYMLLCYGGYDTSSRQLAMANALLAAEDGLNLSMAELKTNIDSDSNGIGTILATAPDGRTVAVTATPLGGNMFRIHSTATLFRARLAADVVAEMVPFGNLAYAARGAVTAAGAVSMSGAITVDGRDWNLTGTSIVGPGKFGISTMSTSTQGGAAQIGGNGWAPARPAHAGTVEQLATWTDGIDQDNDGAVDEEPFDGFDNDGDAAVDEDTYGYPSSPDAMLRVPEGTLKTAAIASGTYFTSQAAYDACVSANGGVVPGGAIIFCEFPVWTPTNFGNVFNDPPSVVVHYYAGGIAQMQNVHGMFKGLILAEEITHLNGDFVLLGGVQAFSIASVANSFGNGNALIRYSSAVLTNLPAPGGQSKVRIRSWNRSAAQ